MTDRDPTRPWVFLGLAFALVAFWVLAVWAVAQLVQLA